MKYHLNKYKLSSNVAEAKETVEVGKKHHRIMPQEFLKGVTHLHHKPLRTVKKTLSNRVTHTEFAKKFKDEHPHHTVQNKNEKLSPLTYSFARGKTSS